MRSVLRVKDFADFERVIEYPENFSESGLQESKYNFDFKGIKSDLKEITFNGVCIHHRKEYLPDGLKVEVEHDFPFLKMQFEINGNSLYQPASNCKSEIVEIGGGTHQLFFLPHVKGMLTFPRLTKRYTLEIKLTVNFLKNVFKEDFNVLEKFGEQVHNNDSTLLNQSSRPITPEMKTVISEIIYCRHTGRLKKIFLETKVVELLLLQVEQMNEADCKKEKSFLKDDDIEKLQHARRIIHMNMVTPYTISELSKQVGINSFKLKKGFKEMFNNTIFGYLTDLRMEKAKNMILSTGQSISEISYEVGYRNPQHFTVAFKKKYGYIPSDLRK
ncbi:helix-turn-helix transcriptional regulator [Chondrinema litorale]|uniref:helix-turn-helix transcriptional regulator n=1 Tax=Chondrinema litorale TaxID=2994555 RepID=UPI0025429429|nr:AraC family transcriptional regulator [Chondrinema litorale]UZR98296.1 AraC family transcriptional regulator [Chondrinema litorale]